jgi:hypothetical protein
MRIRQAATPKANVLEKAVKTESAECPFHEVGWIREWDVVEGGHVSTLGQPCQEDRGLRAANALAGLILLRYGEGEWTFSPMVRRPATMRMAVLVRRPASGPSTSPPDASRRSPRLGLLADSPRPGRTAEQTPQPALQHGPGHQRVLVGYGDDNRRSLPAVLAP